MMILGYLLSLGCLVYQDLLTALGISGVYHVQGIRRTVRDDACGNLC